MTQKYRERYVQRILKLLELVTSQQLRILYNIAVIMTEENKRDKG